MQEAMQLKQRELETIKADSQSKLAQLESKLRQATAV